MNRNGQALIETAVFFLMLSGLLVCLLGMTQWFTLRQKLMLAAREGALLYSSGHFSKREVETMVKDFLGRGSPILNPDRAAIKVGPHPDLALRLMQLDFVSVSYPLHTRWVSALGFNAVQEEKCIVKHAPQFGVQWQPIYGPPVSWFGFDPLGG